MEEIQAVMAKYDDEYVGNWIKSEGEAQGFELTFFQDVGEIYDSMTRVRNVERNSTGFPLQDAPILGLLVQTWKLLKLIIWLYQESKLEFIPIAERSFIEVSVTAAYLLKCDHSVIRDYRLCSFKNRLAILEQLETNPDLSASKAGQRLQKSIREKLASETLNPTSFDIQKNNRWRIQGRHFYEIFREVMGEELYPVVYGASSGSVHSSWHDLMDLTLFQLDDGTFLPNDTLHTADIANLSMILPFSIEPFRLWVKRIEADDEYVVDVLNWVERMNLHIFRKLDQVYSTP